MECREYQLLISAQIDGDMSPAEVVGAERHLSSCVKCAGMYEDLRLIVSEAQELPSFEPDSRLWGHIIKEAEAEGLVHATSRPLWGWFDWVGITAGPRMAMATATMTVLVLVATVWVYHGYRMIPPKGTSGTAEEVQATNEVRQAEQNYLAAIQSLQKISETRMAIMDPSVKGVLEDNLATIDYYIDKCRESVKDEPSNALAQRYLLEAYRKKVDLLASIVHSDVL